MVKFRKTESDAFTSSLKNNLQNTQQIIDKMVSGSEHLMSVVDNGDLSGAAYTATKNLFGQLIIPTIKTFDRIVDDIESDLDSYNLVQNIVSEYSEDLDSENLEKKISNWETGIKKCEQQIIDNNNMMRIFFDLSGYVQSQLYENDQLKRFKEACEDRKREDQEKLERLLEFSSQTSSLFKDGGIAFPIISKAIADLSTTIVDTNGNFYLPPNSNIEFFQSLTTISLSTQKTTIEILAETYGFSDETARDIQELMILIKAANPDLSEKELALKIMLLLASPVYGDSDGLISDNFKWDGTTGSDILTKEEFIEELKKLGYTNEKANKLFNAITSQNTLAGYPEKAGEMKVFIHNNKIPDDRLREHLLNAGHSQEKVNKLLNSKDKTELYQVLAKESHNNVDFAHMMVTGAAELSNSPSFAAQFATNYDAVKAAGWLGDISKIAMAPNIDNSDYKADLDAVNLARRMENGKSFADNLQAYYSEIGTNNTNRATEFKKHYSVDTVINDANKADGSGSIAQTITTTNGVIIIYDNSSKDTLNPIPKNFVESLERNSNDLLDGE